MSNLKFLVVVSMLLTTSILLGQYAVGQTKTMSVDFMDDLRLEISSTSVVAAFYWEEMVNQTQMTEIQLFMEKNDILLHMVQDSIVNMQYKEQLVRGLMILGNTWIWS